MATQTTNYHLIKPAQSDFYDVGDFNGNADIIDLALKANADDIANEITRATGAEQTNANNITKLNNKLAYDNAGAHNAVYRGKSLGSSYTAEQQAAVAAGTFDDMYIGDYWTINGKVWRIAGFDYWLGFGDTACSNHHIVIVPDDNLLAADGSTTKYMNATNITTGAYVGSDFYTGNNSNTAKSQCRTMARNAFGQAHILTHREYFQNAMTNGHASAGAWYDSDIDMMNEIMVYGCPVFTPANDGATIPVNYTIDNSQLPLFRLNHKHICNRAGWWLRDAVSASNFAYVTSYGYAAYNNASDTHIGVRPAFGIC